MGKNEVLIVGCPERDYDRVTSLAVECGFIPTLVPDVGSGIQILHATCATGKKYNKVVSISHTWENYDGEKALRLGSEIARECKDLNIPCVVISDVTGTGSLIQEFLNAARRAGAVTIKTMNWKLAIGYFPS